MDKKITFHRAVNCQVPKYELQESASQIIKQVISKKQHMGKRHLLPPIMTAPGTGVGGVHGR